MTAAARAVAAAALGALLAVPPRPAAAQATVDFGVCLFGAVQACTRLLLTTTPTAAGTDVDLLVRHTTLGAAASAVQGLSFLFPASPTADAVPGTPALGAVGGAPAVPASVAWTAQGLASALVFQDASPLGPPDPAPVQYVAGCAGGALPGGLVETALASCGGGGYRFRFATAAVFDALAVTALTLDVNAGLLDPLGLPTVVTCDLGAGRTDACLDFANLVDPLVPFRATRTVVPASTSAPEPGALGLLAAGLTALVPVATRTRRRRAESPRHLPTFDATHVV